MFSLFKKDPIAKLNKLYLEKLTHAMQAQRNGDIRSYSKLTAEAESLKDEINKLENLNI